MIDYEDIKLEIDDNKRLIRQLWLFIHVLSDDDDKRPIIRAAIQAIEERNEELSNIDEQEE